MNSELLLEDVDIYCLPSYVINGNKWRWNKNKNCQTCLSGFMLSSVENMFHIWIIHKSLIIIHQILSILTSEMIIIRIRCREKKTPPIVLCFRKETKNSLPIFGYFVRRLNFLFNCQLIAMGSVPSNGNTEARIIRKWTVWIDGVLYYFSIILMQQMAVSAFK